MKLINFFLFFIFISVNFSFADINKEFENILMGGDNILEKWYMFKHYSS